MGNKSANNLLQAIEESKEGWKVTVWFRYKDGGREAAHLITEGLDT